MRDRKREPARASGFCGTCFWIILSLDRNLELTVFEIVSFLSQQIVQTSVPPFSAKGLDGFVLTETEMESLWKDIAAFSVVRADTTCIIGKHQRPTCLSCCLLSTTFAQ